MAKVHDNATDLITFARSSSGTALRRVGYGDELVTNGDGSTLTGWDDISAGTGTVASVGGEFELVRVDLSNRGIIEQAITTTVGALYRVSIDRVSGSDVALGIGVSSGSFSLILETLSLGTGTFSFVATSTTTYLNVRGIANGTAYVDNISVKEVIFDRATDPLVLFNHPDDIPRIEYAADGSLKGLLIEEERTNLVTTSAAISGGNWFDNGGVLTENAVTAPDDTQTGSTYDTDGSYRVLRNLVSVVAGTTYTWSFYAKNVDATAVSYRVYDNTQAADIVSATSYFSQISTSDWTRVSVSFTAPAGCSQAGVYLTSGTNGGTVAFWGAQLEVGSFATSYIPTSGSQSTRSPDIASIPVSAFGYNQEAGTVVVEASSLAAVSGYYGSIVNIGSSNYDRIDLGTLNDAGYQSIRDDGIDTAAYDHGVSHNIGAYGSGVTSTAGLAFKLNSANAAVNGSIGTEDTSCTIPTVSEVRIGYDFSSRFRNGHLKSLKYFPRRLTDAQLQELTS